MANVILESLNLGFLSPTEAETILRKICDDSYVLKKASDLSIREHIVAAINSLLAIEKTALIKRIGASELQQQKAVHVQWFVGVGLRSARLHISASCVHERSWFDCHPDQLSNAKHCNETIPNNIREEYARRWAPPTTVGNDMAALYRAAQQPRPVTLEELRERAARHEEAQ
jgi:hypothetical protein